VLGNHDSYHLTNKFYGKETPLKLIQQFETPGIKVLVNSGLSISDELYIGSMKDLYTRDFDIGIALKDSRKTQYKILLLHNLDIISYEKDLENADLIISGHNHAGQINIKGLHLPMPSLCRWLTHGF